MQQGLFFGEEVHCAGGERPPTRRLRWGGTVYVAPTSVEEGGCCSDGGVTERWSWRRKEGPRRWGVFLASLRRHAPMDRRYSNERKGHCREEATTLSGGGKFYCIGSGRDF